ncbi:MAG: hypothetical protein JWL98_990 [Xanthomonadaceae bacterium]|nr:hypothetical protein [Xanthomonadaceae bacterium]
MSHLPDDDQLERLAQLLEQRAVPFRGFNLEALDGYLSALVLSPEPIAADEWQPPVWGTPPRWDSAAERAAVDALLEDQRFLAQQRVCFDGDELPETLAPLLWLPEDPDAEDDDALDVGRDWAFGFFRGVELREAAWERWLDDNDWVDAVFVLLDQLASGEILSDDPTAAPEPISYRQRLDIIGSLPAMLADLQQHRIAALTPREPRQRAATPERNAPCPCGSGRKYKKCCGAGRAT